MAKSFLPDRCDRAFSICHYFVSHPSIWRQTTAEKVFEKIAIGFLQLHPNYQRGILTTIISKGGIHDAWQLKTQILNLKSQKIKQPQWRS